MGNATDAILTFRTLPHACTTKKWCVLHEIPSHNCYRILAFNLSQFSNKSLNERCSLPGPAWNKRNDMLVQLKCMQLAGAPCQMSAAVSYTKRMHPLICHNYCIDNATHVGGDKTGLLSELCEKEKDAYSQVPTSVIATKQCSPYSKTYWMHHLPHLS